MKKTAMENPDVLVDVIIEEMPQWKGKLAGSTEIEQRKGIKMLVELSALDKSGVAAKRAVENIFKCSKIPHTAQDTIQNFITEARDDSRLALVMAGIGKAYSSTNPLPKGFDAYSLLALCVEQPNFGADSMGALAAVLRNEKICDEKGRKLLYQKLKEKYAAQMGNIPQHQQAYIEARLPGVTDEILKDGYQALQGQLIQQYENESKAKEQSKLAVGNGVNESNTNKTDKHGKNQSRLEKKASLTRRVYNLIKKSVKFVGKAAWQIIKLPYAIGIEIEKMSNKKFGALEAKRYHETKINARQTAKNKDYLWKLRYGYNQNLDARGSGAKTVERKTLTQDEKNAFFNKWKENNYHR